MSFQATAWAREQRTGSPSAKSVLMALASYTGEFGECRPSNRTIAHDTEQSVDSVRRRLAELTRKGLIRRFERVRQNGARTSNEIVLLCDEKAKAFALTMFGTPEFAEIHHDDTADQVMDDPQHLDPPLADCEGVPLADCKGAPSTGARAPLALVLPQEHTLNLQLKDSPLPPRGEREADLDMGGEKGKDRWPEFQTAWAFENPHDLVEAARKRFRRLLADDQASAIRHAGAYRASCRQKNIKQLFAATWLSNKGWEGFENAPQKPEVKTVWIAIDSPQFAAWTRHWREVERRTVSMWTTERVISGKAQRGTWRPSEWPPAKSVGKDNGAQASAQDHTMEAAVG